MVDDFRLDTEFEVNVSAVLAASQHLGDMAIREAPRIQKGASFIAKELLLSVFEEAIINADEDDGFPLEFQEHVLRAVEKIPIDAVMGGGTVFVTVDFDALGTREDLTRAFHQGAKLAEGGLLDGPYTGQLLAQEDAEERHIFWEAVRSGQTKIKNPKGTGYIPIAPDAWEQTKRKYVEIWGEKAPEWLYLQFGQNQWSPTVPAQDVIGDFATRLNGAMASYLSDILEEELRIVNQYQTVGANVGFTAKGGVRLTGGAITNPKTGLPYKKGQFIPKNLG